MQNWFGHVELDRTRDCLEFQRTGLKTFCENANTEVLLGQETSSPFRHNKAHAKITALIHRPMSTCNNHPKFTPDYTRGCGENGIFSFGSNRDLEVGSRSSKWHESTTLLKRVSESFKDQNISRR